MSGVISTENIGFEQLAGAVDLNGDPLKTMNLAATELAFANTADHSSNRERWTILPSESDRRARIVSFDRISSDGKDGSLSPESRRAEAGRKLAYKAVSISGQLDLLLVPDSYPLEPQHRSLSDAEADVDAEGEVEKRLLIARGLLYLSGAKREEAIEDLLTEANKLDFDEINHHIQGDKAGDNKWVNGDKPLSVGLHEIKPGATREYTTAVKLSRFAAVTVADPLNPSKSYTRPVPVVKNKFKTEQYQPDATVATWLLAKQQER